MTSQGQIGWLPDNETQIPYSKKGGTGLVLSLALRVQVTLGFQTI